MVLRHYRSTFEASGIFDRTIASGGGITKAVGLSKTPGNYDNISIRVASVVKSHSQHLI